jgi:alpha-beta hydrolase superfamily lysophospholipase
MPTSTFRFPSSDGLQVTVYRWEPQGAPIAAVQVTHGMGEHALRYEKFARDMNAKGFVVYAQDQRGHGETAGAGALGDLGEGGWPALVEDIGRLNAQIRAEHPGLPLILVAHSMGSFAAQQYLLDHSADVDAVVLTGTAVIDLLEPALDLDQPLDLTMFNAPFEPARTAYDWLSRDQAEVDSYVADPRCGFGIDQASAKAMFVGARRMADPSQVDVMRKDLPVYIAVGEADPINGALTVLDPLVDRYRAAGLTDVVVHTYPEARHEVLNETNRAEVIADLSNWLDQVLARSRASG